MDWRNEISSLFPEAVFGWPRDWSKTEIITCRTADDSPEISSDDMEYSSAVEIFMDYFNVDANEYFSGVSNIQSRMGIAGWQRMFSTDVDAPVEDGQNGLYHRSMRFKKDYFFN